MPRHDGCVAGLRCRRRRLLGAVLAALLGALGLAGSAAAAQQASGIVYLSFDDGPSQYTPQILATLGRYGAHATFFEIGQAVAGHGDVTREVAQQGNSVQNHTWSHPDLRLLSASAFAYQVTATDTVIRAETGYTPSCLRPPYDAVNSSVYGRAAGLGKQIQLWTVDSRDWARPGTSLIAQRVLTGVHVGSIVLLHDGGGDRSQTVAALPTILTGLESRGYTFGVMCR